MHAIDWVSATWESISESYFLLCCGISNAIDGFQDRHIRESIARIEVGSQ